MPHVFTYGSLMFAAVWERIVQGSYGSAPAQLPGYTRKAVIGEHYPVVFSADRVNSVAGLVYHDVSFDDLQRLDDFEAEYYVRQTAAVILSQGLTLSAEVYVVKRQYQHIAAEQDWDPDEFLEKGLSAFLNEYRGFLSEDFAGPK